ncbi:TRAP transporter large permease subunit [Chloroflexota bacterium]
MAITRGILKSAKVVKTVISRISWISAVVGCLAIIACVISTVIDVISRSTTNTNIPGNIELIGVLLVIVFFSGMSYTEINNKHVKVDILVNKFSPTAKQVVELSGNLITIGIVSIISWQSVLQSNFVRTSGYHTGVLHIPLWPFGIITAFFLALFALTVLINLFQSLDKFKPKRKLNGMWLLSGIIVTFILFGISLYPSIFLNMKIEPSIFGIIAMAVMFALIFLNVHIGTAMAVVALGGVGYLGSSSAGLALLGMTSQSTASNYVWSVIPLFMLMGVLVAVAGLGRDLYSSAYKWLGHLPGGLASATVVACGGFAAIVGDVLSGALTMSTVALPQMKEYGYDTRLATGAIAAGSTLGSLIPPSLSFIVYGIMVEQSIGRLFIAGIIPGMLMVISFILMISIRCHINPRLGPPGPSSSFIDKLICLKYSWPVIILFCLVIGGIYAGIFSATEAGAIGVFSAVVIALVMRRFTFRAFFQSTMEAVVMASMVFFIFIYATTFSQFLAITQLPFALSDFINGLSVHPYITLGLIMIMYFLLGCVMNALPVIILTLPIIYPVVIGLGFDPIWFGVLLVVATETGPITPPIGITVFALAGASGIPMYTIFRGVTFYWIVMLSVLIILMIFPQISLFLPNLMMGD